MTLNTYIAMRTWAGLSPAGERKVITARIAAPVCDTEGRMSCLADPGFDEAPVSIFGEDSWQALELALRFCRDIARGKMQRGWQLRWPDTDELLASSDL
ncbi:hypothetical protein E4L96_23175 [Massilia arenosa]|uniref:Uncharacterized protein n=1 Tax=Zemynaea arenosa TaxID=2561931 RepID=A0A4Y9RMV1_9BURK|nr:hypothetical protein [Massilia arenosa]TFW10617.1 hypothetical protein E4L96_23175 [Massilia arenosa]